MSVPQNPTSKRSRRPVFVVGCHRSGTNLLYDTLLSAGGFAIYRGYLPIHKMLIPRFGSLENVQSRKNIVQTWLRSKGFRKSGLDAETLSAELLARARNGGDFIHIVMDKIAGAQSAQRWAVYDPDSGLYMQKIKSEIPEALFLHIVRDGRDIALSLKKMGEFRPFPWNRKPASLELTALYWKWMVETAREAGRSTPEDYVEVHFEELVGDPRRALKTLSTFLDQDLDYDRIQASSLGRLSESNSSFLGEVDQNRPSPVNRWKQRLSAEQIAVLESLVGDCLEHSGYALVTSSKQRQPGLQHKFLKSFYPAFFNLKKWLKVKTPAGRMTDLSALELSDNSGDFPNEVGKRSPAPESPVRRK